ncbi:competence type IV pilus ATPase ComGA [Sporolactobacillus terrae]|uniref:Competence protein ComG n=1 Tax=Sporolactobacillus terrae TaxID=269673 RepID=A0A410D9I5_9BACL|nr:competence type IV pilus ATPase ComGA [Sporolactobacillus terrae]QAA22750.1 type II/IV secretion system protein [Sporolactobacillus terrae]QAA25723.1 type II/IV secretion system protein [Sporolactobacillus terrae]BBN99086.1 competence protein ComG [Sporolactobacillus terrae]
MSEIDSSTLEKSRDLLKRAHESGASDLHFTPREKDTLVELRINGYLYELSVLKPSSAEQIINHFKFCCGMDIGERRLPQSGGMRVVINHDLVYLRASILPTANEESLVIRLLPQQTELPIDDLTVFEEAKKALCSLLSYDSGLILISGPTGSGKTTTLYSILSTLQRRYRARVITIEDPIEKKNDAFVQMEVNEKAHFTYAEGFRALLRHDPDILMIGEIRDEETARIAIRAALSGHLVLSTVHASNAVTTLQRMAELGIARFDLKETLVAVIAERLVTIQCPNCGQVCNPECPHRHHPKRTGLFEILAGMPLHDYLSGRQSRTASLSYKTIEDYLEEGIESGWIARDAARRGAEDVLSEKFD